MRRTALSSSHYRPEAGDIYACWGSDVVSRGISLETSLLSFLTGPSGLRWSPSHVAIAAHHNSELRWYESTTMASRECLSACRRVAGAQVHSVRDRLRDYVIAAAGRVDVYRLTAIDMLEFDEERMLAEMMSTFVGDLIEKRDPVRYDSGGAIFSGTRFVKWLPFSRADLNSVFCSELIAAVLQRLCRMNRDNPARYNPGMLLRRLVRQGTYARLCSFTKSSEVCCG
jgi:hypothetical protein